MTPVAYYNEYDPGAAAWLRELIKAGLIAPGVVDERSILDVTSGDLAGFTQCHFFAGIGGWSLALRLAGVPDTAALWTGSCPCQPFSDAGKGAGFADERHLWPALHHLLRQRRPELFLGEQVASKDGLTWLDLVQADLEGTGYAVGAFDLAAAGVGAPHIRQRLWIVGHTLGARLEGFGRDVAGAGAHRPQDGREARSATSPGAAMRLGNADSNRTGWVAGAFRGAQAGEGGRDSGHDADAPGDPRGLADSECDGSHRAQGHAAEPRRDGQDDGLPVGSGGVVCGASVGPGPTNGFWRDADWLSCRDGKWRPVEPGTQPLANGIPERVAILRGAGNAINPYVAKIFIEAAIETIKGK